MKTVGALSIVAVSGILGLSAQGFVLDWERMAHITQTVGAVLAILVPGLLAIGARYIRYSIESDINRREVIWKEKETLFRKDFGDLIEKVSRQIDDQHSHLVKRLDEREKVLRDERERKFAYIEEHYVMVPACVRMHEDLERWIETKIQPFNDRTDRIERQINTLLELERKKTI